MRLIDADALREKWLCLQGHDFSPSSFVYSIDYAPTVDAAQVVRCGDCKHRDPEDKRCDCGGHEWVKGKILPVKDDWFCADGERKDGAE